jgi:hypothetical protein
MRGVPINVGRVEWLNNGPAAAGVEQERQGQNKVDQHPLDKQGHTP